MRGRGWVRYALVIRGWSEGVGLNMVAREVIVSELGDSFESVRLAGG